MASRRKKRTNSGKDWESELLKEGSSLIEKAFPQKPKKKCYFEFHTDSSTGRRATVHPYRPRFSDAASEVGELDSISNEDIIYPATVDIEEEESLEETIKKCQDIISSLPKVTQSWDDRMASLNENWDNCRSQIFEVILSEEGVMEDEVCGICQQGNVEVRCFSCRKSKLCHTCDTEIHREHPFHDRDVFVNGCFVPVPPTVIVSESGDLIDTYQCPSLFKPNCCPYCKKKDVTEQFTSKNTLIIVNEKGRFDFSKPNYFCTSCRKDLGTINLASVVKAGYWPGSPNDITYIFHQDMFVLWNAIQKRMPGISENAFVRSLEDISSLKGRAPKINSSTFSKSFREWKFCQFGLIKEQNLNWMKCPPCSVDQHSCHVDGNMKLYRYKKSGSERNPSYYGDCFIAKKEDVDEHIRIVYSKQQKTKEGDDNTCGETHWKAAGNKLKKKANMDETGLEIAGCRHGLAQWAVNMYQGEIYGYPHYIQCKRMQPAKVRFFWEDVVCKYWGWAQRTGIPVGNMKPALSVMHAKAHSWSCQIIWGGRWQTGSACSTGEEVEQINAYLSRCGNTTKYMLPENRDELLTEHALAWNKRKIVSMVNSLCRRYTRALQMKASSKEKLSKIVADQGIRGVDEARLQEWKSEVVQYAKKSQIRGDSQLSSLQQQIEMLYFSTAQTKMFMNKLAGSSKQRTRLRKRLQENNNKIKGFVEQYNDVLKKSGGSQAQLVLADVQNGKFSWEDRVQGTPIRVKSHLVEMSEICKRWEEEVDLVQLEMKNFVKFYTHILMPDINKRASELQLRGAKEQSESHKVQASDEGDIPNNCKVVQYSTKSTHPAVVKGKINLLNKGLLFCKLQLQEALTKFQMVIENAGNVLPLITDASTRDDDDDEVDNDQDNNSDEVDEEDEDEDEELGDQGQESPIPSCVIPGKECVGLPSVFTWEFPSNISQSTYQGRNGSNACSVIALVLAHSLTKSNVQLHRSSSLCPQWVEVICSSIVNGNNSYDCCRSSLPHRFLSAAEAAVIVDDIMDVSVAQPLPIRICDPHEESTLKFHLSALCADANKVACCALFIANGKTVLFVAVRRAIIHIDTHHHGHCGSIISLGSYDNLNEFIIRCQKVMDLDNDAYGNFCMLKFFEH